MMSLLSRSYRVVHAANGAEGLGRAQELNPDIVISDVMMPDMDGFEMCRKLKGDIATSHIPIILLSAKIGIEDKVEGLKGGAQAYLTKPIQPKVLYAQIESLLNNIQIAKERFGKSEGNATSPPIEYSSIDEQFLTRATAVVNDNLTNTEFDVKDFIAIMGITNSMLYRKLKSLTNLSPNEFIRNIRLKVAHSLISEKYETISISEIAYAVGFNIPNYFTACFKREFGYTPSQYKEQLIAQNRDSKS